MSLAIIGTPIGHLDDLGLRALRILKEADVLITEERKVGSQLLRHHGVTGKDLYELNEHTAPNELKDLLKICQEKKVALISDGGTPGFCDPGADLVAICRKHQVSVFSVPGPSSLMAFLSICGKRLDQFIFRGFISVQTEVRKQQLISLSQNTLPVVLMDTPYRLQKLLKEIRQFCSDPEIILGINLAHPDEKLFEGKVSRVLKQLPVPKAEFVLVILPQRV